MNEHQIANNPINKQIIIVRFGTAKDYRPFRVLYTLVTLIFIFRFNKKKRQH